MIRQKKGFLTWVCSLLPGAGEMYMGFNKLGVSLMVLFWGIIAVSGILNIGMLLMGLPIVWLYSFFNVNHLSSLSEEEFYSLEDHFLFQGTSWDMSGFLNHPKAKAFIGVILVFAGVVMLWDSIVWVLYDILPAAAAEILTDLGYRIPKFLIGAGIVYAGIWLLKGKKKELDEDENA